MTHYEELVWAEYDRLTNNWEKFDLADKVEVPELAEEIRARIKEERDTAREDGEKEHQYSENPFK